MTHMTAVFGGGVMGEAIIAGLLRNGTSPDALRVTERHPDRADYLFATYGVNVVSNQAAAEQADNCLIVVKPQDVAALLAETAPHLRAGTLVVSLVAGVSTEFLERRLAAGTPVVRVMPNTPAIVDEGVSAISAGSVCTEEHMTRVEGLLSAVGEVIRVPESQQDAVTAISGSGPAYIFYIVEAMIEAGVLLGISRAQASELVIQTLYGSAKMVRETGIHPTVLRENVTSPAGTTAAALRELDQHKVRAAFLQAMEAARDRSRELGSMD